LYFCVLYILPYFYKVCEKLNVYSVDYSWLNIQVVFLSISPLLIQLAIIVITICSNEHNDDKEKWVIIKEIMINFFYGPTVMAKWQNATKNYIEGSNKKFWSDCY
jgi:hypothetical protein